jgi:hypothetical protein
MTDDVTKILLLLFNYFLFQKKTEKNELEGDDLLVVRLRPESYLKK